MPQPQPISNDLIAELNLLRDSGRILDFDFRMGQLKKQIESLSKSDPKYHRALLSAFYGLIGNWDNMHSHGMAAVRTYRDDAVRIFYTTTLLSTGFVSEGAEILGQADWSSLDLSVLKLELGYTCSMYNHIIAYSDICKNANVPIPEYIDMQMIQATHDILTASGISESTVNAMLDIAGEIMREHGVVMSHDIYQKPDSRDGTVTILQSIKASAEQVAEMDWEYALRLFERMPDAPATVVYVGFKVAYQS